VKDLRFDLRLDLETFGVDLKINGDLIFEIWLSRVSRVFRTDSTDSPDSLPISLSISVSFSFFSFFSVSPLFSCCFRAVDQSDSRQLLIAC